MNKIQSNNLNVIVNIQYAIGFELVEGNVEIEVSIFNHTQKSHAVDGGRNRLNFYEEFIWNINRANLKYYRSTNEIVKVECFTTPNISYGHIYRRQRIGHVIIKLKEFQILGRDWDQNISVRCYKFLGCSGHYQIQMLLIIQEDSDFEISRKINNNKHSRLNSSETYVKNVKQSISDKKQDKNQQIIKPTTKEKGIIINRVNTYNGNPINKGNINYENINKQQLSKIKNNKITESNKLIDQMNEKDEKNMNNFGNTIDKQDFQETMSKYGLLLNDSNIKQNKTQKKERETNNELVNMKKKFENVEVLKASDDGALNEMLTNGLKCTEEFSQIMKKMKTEFSKNVSKRHSSNSSVKTDSDLEQLVILAFEIMKKIFKFIEMFKKNGITNKSKISQDITSLMNTACILSEFCDNLTKYIEIRGEV